MEDLRCACRFHEKRERICVNSRILIWIFLEGLLFAAVILFKAWGEICA